MAKFKMGVTPSNPPVTARLGAGTGSSNNLTDKEQFKFVKFVGDSRYDLCAAGDKIEGQIVALEKATQDGYTIGSVKVTGRINAVCDGLEATAGTGSIAVGDYVVVGTVVAKGTALSGTIPAPKVCKATNQPGANVDNLNKTGDLTKNVLFAWRVISLGDAGAVGDTCVIERVTSGY
jgi:hypothetical protein